MGERRKRNRNETEGRPGGESAIVGDIRLRPEQIRRLRAGLGLSQTEFGALVGVDGGATTVSRWERGESRPRGISRRRLAEIAAEHAAITGDVTC